MTEQEALTVWRALSALLALACTGALCALITYYVRVVRPIRDQIGERRVLAPPAGWSLAYHGFVLLLVVFVGERLLYGTLNPEVGASLATFGWAPTLVGLTLAAGKFVRYYTETLRAARSQEDRRASGDVY